MAKGELLRLKRGLYTLAQKYQSQGLHPFAIANRLSFGSYVSFESALSWHGWIPERVEQVRSAVPAGASFSIDNARGNFLFTPLRTRELRFLDGVERVTEGAQSFFLARPLRALADHVYAGGSAWNAQAILSGLRIESDALSALQAADFDQVRGAFRSRRVLRFLDSLQKELKPHA